MYEEVKYVLDILGGKKLSWKIRNVFLIYM